jgi:hypothetical protein
LWLRRQAATALFMGFSSLGVIELARLTTNKATG